MTTINTNIAAMTAANSIKTNDRSMAVAMERLSTGLRINSAADDAAGLAISTKMTSQIRGLDVATRNANDAISMIQVADGAAGEITDMLQRMRELTVQSSNGVNSSADRTNLNQEFKQLSTAIDKIAETTEFNGRQILNGNATSAGKSTVTFQVGANSGAIEQLVVDFSDFNLIAGSGSTAASAGTTSSIVVAATPAASPAASGDENLLTAIQSDIAAGITIFDGETVSGVKVGTTIKVDLQDVQVANNNVSITAGTVTEAQFITAINFVGANSSTFGFTASGSVNDGAIDFNDTSGREGTAKGIEISFSTFSQTFGTQGIAGDPANPMAADLSSFKTAGIDENDFAATLDKLDAALAGVASQRATFGAAVNTLEHTVDNLVTVSGNQSAARSQILDADYAAETTALARTQIISQAGTAMLSQANQAAQGVLALLR